MKIFGWACDMNGCGQYRIGLPMWALGAAGHDARAFLELNTELPEDLDVLVGQRVCGPEQSALWLDLARRADRRYRLVFEIDDDLWNLHPSNVHATRVFTPEALARMNANIAAADAVTVTTEHLAEMVRPLNSNVHVIPNCVDASLLSHQRPHAPKVTVGWAGGGSHGIDFAAVEAELTTFLRRNPEVDTHFIGANFGAAVGRPETRHTGWTTNLVEYMHSIDFDIGIAPLAQHTFNRSKSDLKALEYAALGIPVVATDYGPYSDSVRHGVTGLLVKRPHEWSRHLHDLVNDEAMRVELGNNARNWAATRTMQANIWRWEEAYRPAPVLVPAARAGERHPDHSPVTDQARGCSGIVVLGMHRSGTSAVTGLLTGAGFSLGSDDAMGADVHNQTGYHELFSTAAISDEILAESDGSWDCPPLGGAPGEQAKERVNAMVDRLLECAAPAPLVVKDPRVPLILPAWSDVVGSLLTPLLVVRNPLEVAQSLNRRDRMSLPAGLALWEITWRRLLAGVSGIPTYVVRYEHLMNEPGRVEQLLNWAKSSVDGPSSELLLTSSVNGIDSELRRNRESSNALAGYATVAQLELWDYLQSLATGEQTIEPPNCNASSDSWHAVLSHDRAMRSGLTSSGQQSAAVNALANELDHTKRVLEESTGVIEEMLNSDQWRLGEMMLRKRR